MKNVVIRSQTLVEARNQDFLVAGIMLSQAEGLPENSMGSEMVNDIVPQAAGKSANLPQIGKGVIISPILHRLISNGWGR